MPTLYLLNTPVLTAYGDWQFTGPLTITETQDLLKSGFVSAVGHEGTAELLSTILAMPIPTNRISITMQPHDKAVVFRLKTRMPEGQVLNKEAIEKLPFEFALLTRIR